MLKVKTVIGLLSLGLFVLTISALAKAQTHEHHTRVGSHGMAVYTDGVTLFAHHLPLYSAPHDVQLVYAIETQYKAEIIAHLMQQPLSAGAPTVAVTVLPEVFDLNVLVAEQPLTISAQWFDGHFERGGTPWFEDPELQFLRAVYAKPLVVTEAINHTEKPIQFDMMSAANAGDMVVHRITSRPSFDAVLRVNECSTSASREVNGEGDVMSAESILAAFDDCATRQLLYYETRDFAH